MNNNIIIKTRRAGVAAHNTLLLLLLPILIPLLLLLQLLLLLLLHTRSSSCCTPAWYRARVRWWIRRTNHGEIQIPYFTNNPFCVNYAFVWSTRLLLYHECVQIHHHARFRLGTLMRSVKIRRRKVMVSVSRKVRTFQCHIAANRYQKGAVDLIYYIHILLLIMYNSSHGNVIYIL
jgi:hypothetical protein|uniref:Uncharacterized protein n=1 Tax=Sipha flava TaxID=143950 RepID=A0A2S2R016_9HEMI